MIWRRCGTCSQMGSASRKFWALAGSTKPGWQRRSPPLPDLDGVVWHTITPYTGADRLSDLIRDHLGLNITTAEDRTWAELARRQVLIVMDNAETAPIPAHMPRG